MLTTLNFFSKLLIDKHVSQADKCQLMDHMKVHKNKETKKDTRSSFEVLEFGIFRK